MIKESVIRLSTRRAADNSPMYPAPMRMTWVRSSFGVWFLIAMTPLDAA